MKYFLPLTLIIYTACAIETGYRHDIKPLVNEFNETLLSFQIFIQINHRGKEVEAEDDLNMLHNRMDQLRTRFQLIASPSDANKKTFHDGFSSSMAHTYNVIADYKQKFRIQISINNIEEEYNRILKQIKTATESFQSAQTAGGKNSFRKRIVSLTSERDTSKTSLEDTRERYLAILKKLLNHEQFYFSRYPSIQKTARTSVFLSLVPAPKYLVNEEEKEKYFPYEMITD
jgi:hypothetical protein